MANTHSDTDLVATAERRAHVLRLRRAGYTYREVAERTAEHFHAERLPSGWDERYAAKDVRRELKRLRDENTERTEQVREIEAGRLDDLQSALWDDALDGDAQAVRQVLNVMQRRARLMGLDEPEQHEVRGTLDVRFVELRGIILGALDDYPEARVAVADALAEHAEEQ